MNSKSGLKKGAALVLAVAVFGSAGLGLGTASADNGKSITEAPVVAASAGDGSIQGTIVAAAPSPVNPVAPVVQSPAYFSWMQAPVPVQFQQPVQLPFAYVPNSVYVNAAAAELGSTNLVSGTSEVLGLSPQAIIIELEQGRTLSQIAIERGWNRDAFISALTARLQQNVMYGLNLGTVQPAMATALLRNLAAQVAVGVDQSSMSGALEGISFASLYQFFS